MQAHVRARARPIPERARARPNRARARCNCACSYPGLKDEMLLLYKEMFEDGIYLKHQVCA